MCRVYFTRYIEQLPLRLQRSVAPCVAHHTKRLGLGGALSKAAAFLQQLRLQQCKQGAGGAAWPARYHSLINRGVFAALEVVRAEAELGECCEYS